jgi:hypothetical protein
MTESGRIGVKAVSTIIAAVIVLTIFLGLASAIYAGIFQLGNEAHILVKREAERAMESFFRIYWLNETHVVLFNNHSSVPIKLLYWVRVNPASGSYTVYNLFNSLDPAKYTVKPSGMKIVDIRTEVPTRNRDSVDRVVSEKGSTFEVTDAPTDIASLVYFTPSEKIVRPGFNGRLTNFVVSTGPDFGGGDVTITCINIINTGTLVTLPCTDWGISFVTPFGPGNTVTVPAGGVGVLGVNALIPPTFNQYGFYVVKLRLQSSSFTREYSMRVIVTNFSPAISPGVISLTGCINSANLVVTFAGPRTHTGHIHINVSRPTGLNVFASPNPAHPPVVATGTAPPGTVTIAQIMVERIIATPPTGTVTSPLTVILNDGLGDPRTVTFTAVHSISVTVVTVLTDDRRDRVATLTLIRCP